MLPSTGDGNSSLTERVLALSAQYGAAVLKPSGSFRRHLARPCRSSTSVGKCHQLAVGRRAGERNDYEAVRHGANHHCFIDSDPHGLPEIPDNVGRGPRVQVHVASPDPFAPSDQVSEWSNGAARLRVPASVYSYPDAGHFFTDSELADYDAKAVRRLEAGHQVLGGGRRLLSLQCLAAGPGLK
ncbi:dienelactone hydrolase family protein [Mesorhizobium sp. CA6]|uniref:dienelactone hydrolase family protein n=1 Tax=Mesorhizobium sp. CA6 TaxID=588500 RepID=UPI001CCBCA4A|nr:dienelactone hydrolase family protein [Mesorhizobium sp. CA6]